MKRHVAFVAALLVCGLSHPAYAQLAGRLIDAVDSTERGDHIDISIIFGCGLRYLGHAPAMEGDTVRLRFAPLPDCGNLTGALGGQPSLDGAREIRSIETDQLVLNEVNVAVHFAASERFVLAPTADSHGVRIRLLRKGATGAKVTVGESNKGPTGYAINLEAAREPYDEAAVQAATRATGNPAYVSEYKLGEQTWYRLRIGPFDTEAGARKVLMAARGTYPKAWLAIGDDEIVNADGSAATPVAPTRPGPAPTMTADDIETTFRKAKTAFGHKDYATAIPLLTRLLEQPEHPRRAQEQELLGLARERSRQIAHAKAEYEEYLRRYPEGPAVPRVRERLRALRLAARKSVGAWAQSDEDEAAWKIYGGVAQTYRRDTLQVDNSAQSLNLTSQNALISDADVVARRRGERFSFSSRISAGYLRDMLPDGPGNQTRVNYAFVELNDRERDWSARLGRQSRNTGGLFGTFDGLTAGKQVLPHLRVDATFGYPVEISRQGFDTSRKFMGLSFDLGTFRDAWDVALYGLSQSIDGKSDRQAFGSEVRYIRPGRTIVALADYDTHFKELNNALLLASFALPAQWTLSANIDRRKSPPLSLRNALIGQTSDSLEDLLLTLTRDEIEQLARDRTADAKLYSLSLARPFGARWEWTLDFSSFNTAGTPASGGVEEVVDSGTDSAVSLQGLASGLLGGNDLSGIVLRHQSGKTIDVDSLGILTRFPVWQNWRLGPRLRVDRRQLHDDGSTEMLYIPTLRLDLQRSRALFECEVGAEIGRRAIGESNENTTRYYFSLGYRLNF